MSLRTLANVTNLTRSEVRTSAWEHIPNDDARALSTGRFVDNPVSGYHQLPHNVAD